MRYLVFLARACACREAAPLEVLGAVRVEPDADLALIEPDHGGSLPENHLQAG